MANVGYATLQVIPSVRGIAGEIRRQLVPPAEDAGQEAGQRAGGRFGDVFKTSVAAAGVAAGAALVYGVTKTIERESAGNKLAAQLGLSGQQAQRLGRIAGAIYTKGYGESITQVNDSLRALAQNGVTAVNAPRKELAGLSKAALNVAQTFDVDVTEAARAAGQMMRTGLASNARQAFDLIARGMSTGADKAGDLLDTLNEYSTQFRDLGLTGQQAVGLLTQGLRNGARDADIVADALKEFAIRAKDGSDTTKAGFDAIGLSASTMAATFAQGGPKAAKALDTVLDRLRGIKDPARRSQVAIALFGTQAEDLQQSLFSLDPSTATKALGDVGGAADKMGKTLHSGAGAEVERFKRRLETSLVNFTANSLIPALREIAPVVGAALAPLRELWQWLAADPARMQAAAAALLAIGGAIVALKVASAVIGGVQTLVGGIRATATAARTAGGHIRFAAFAVRYYTTLAAASAKQAIITGARWAASAARAGAGWVAARARAAAAFARTAASATVNAARTAGAWVAAQARTMLATIRATAAMVAQRAAMIASSVATRAAAAAQWLLNAAMRANPIGLVITALVALGALFVVLWKRSETFRNIVRGALRGVMIVVRALGAVGLWLWRSVFRPVFRLIGDVVLWLWKNVIKRYFALIKWQFEVVGAIARWLWKNAVRPAFEGVAKVARWLYDNVLKPVFDKGKRAVRLFGDAFKAAKDAIARQWRKLEGIAKKPINFIINTVYNKGIVPVWNKVATAFGADKLSKFQGFARGGVAEGVRPGYTPGRDNALIAVGGGEAIMRPEWTRAVGPGYVNTMNAAARRGGVGGVARAMGVPGYADGGIVPGFADGGIFEWIGKGLQGVGGKAWDFIKRGTAWLRDTLAASARAGVRHVVEPLLDQIPGLDNGFGRMLQRMPRKMVDALFGYAETADRKRSELGIGGKGTRDALRFARAQAGEPYVWGGVGPYGYDCSGFLGALQNVIAGRNPYSRLWSTFAFQGANAPGGWVRGMRAPYMVGITNAGVGHTAGTLNGVNVESRGGAGVLVGGRARGYNSPLFGSWYGYRPSRTYDDGGWLMPGATAAFNHTGKPEAVLTAPQWQAIEAAATRGTQPTTLEGDLYLDGGEFLGRVRGVVRDEFDGVVRVARAGRKGRG